MTTYHPDAIGLHPSEQRWCTHCNTVFPATDEFFYRSKGKIHGNHKACAIKLAGERQRREAAIRNGRKKPELKAREKRMHDNRLCRVIHDGPTKGTLEHVVFCRWQPTDVDRVKRYECI